MRGYSEGSISLPPACVWKRTGRIEKDAAYSFSCRPLLLAVRLSGSNFADTQGLIDEKKQSEIVPGKTGDAVEEVNWTKGLATRFLCVHTCA